MTQSKNVLYWLLPITCFLGNLSQLPLYAGMTQALFKVLWVILLSCAFLLQGKNLYINKAVFSFAVSINLLLFFLTYWTGTGYFSSYILSNINLCIFVALVSYMIGLCCDESILYSVSWAYVLSALFCGVWVYLRYFHGVDWLGTSAYLYGGKNSMATILLCAMMLCYFFLWRQCRWFTLLVLAVASVLIFVLKSRASILCMVLFLFYIAVIRTKDRRVKVLAFLLLAGVAAFILYHPTAHEVVIDQILFNNKDASDLSAVTSNRDRYLQKFLENFPHHWLLGHGSGFLECFPLSILFNFGVVGALPIFALSVYPLYVGHVYQKRNPASAAPEFLVVMNLILWTNGLFEEQPPFGPGVKCSLLWMAMGLLLGFGRKQREENLCQK